MVTNVSAFSVRELANQNQLRRFRTAQILSSGNVNTSGLNASYSFHASGFSDISRVNQIIMVANGAQPTNYNVEFFMTSGMTSSDRQYFFSNINLRAIDSPNYPIPLFDIGQTGCLHGKITQNTSGGSFFMDFIELRYNRILPSL